MTMRPPFAVRKPQPIDTRTLVRLLVGDHDPGIERLQPQTREQAEAPSDAAPLDSKGLLAEVVGGLLGARAPSVAFRLARSLRPLRPLRPLR